MHPQPGTRYWWAREDLQYRAGRLAFAGHDVTTLAEAATTPVFLYSALRIDANLERVRTALAGTGRKCAINYAMKANRFSPILEKLAVSGEYGVDICSPNELDHALACGFTAERISFTGTGVSTSDLERLLRHDRLTINCDTIGMIRRIGERCPGRDIGIRVNPGIGTGYDDADKLSYAGSKTTKFGIYREQWRAALLEARHHGLRVVGLHFHVGCGYLNGQLDRWDAAIGSALSFLDDAPEIQTVNVGGGLGVPHRSGDEALNLARWATILTRRFADRNVQIAIEPGDYIVKDAGILVLSVTDVEWKRDTQFVFVNGGFNLHPEPVFYDLPCEPVPCLVGNAASPAHERVTIAGNINEALDLWAADIPMPPLGEGDLIAFINAGGYGSAMSSNHCLRGDFSERLI